MMQGYVNENYEAIISVAVKNGIDAAKTEPLLGMALLRGYRLQVDAIEGGLVTIETLLNIN
jgi:hypothetical protein